MASLQADLAKTLPQQEKYTALLQVSAGEEDKVSPWPPAETEGPGGQSDWGAQCGQGSHAGRGGGDCLLVLLYLLILPPAS